MARPLPAYPSSEVEFPIVAPLLADMDSRDVFVSLLDPATWIIELLRARRNGTLTRQHLMHVLVWLITTLGVPNMKDHWAQLAAADTLGRIDTTTLTRSALAELIRHAAALHMVVMGGHTKDPTKLRLAVESRKTSTRAIAGAAAAPYLVFLDRVGEKLTPYFRP